jgi:hypothetical protein
MNKYIKLHYKQELQHAIDEYNGCYCFHGKDWDKKTEHHYICYRHNEITKLNKQEPLLLTMPIKLVSKGLKTVKFIKN